MWTYDNTDLDTTTSSGRLNVVRLLVGDTDTNDQQVENEEITFALSTEGNNVYKAAGWIARTLSAKYSRYVDVDLDGQLAESYSQLREHYSVLASKLDKQADSKSVTLGVSAGGISLTDMYTADQDTDRPQSNARVDEFVNPIYKWGYNEPFE